MQEKERELFTKVTFISISYLIVVLLNRILIPDILTLNVYELNIHKLENPLIKTTDVDKMRTKHNYVNKVDTKFFTLFYMVNLM